MTEDNEQRPTVAELRAAISWGTADPVRLAERLGVSESHAALLLDAIREEFAEPEDERQAP